MKWIDQKRQLSWLSALALGGPGCASTLNMEAEAAGQPHTTIPYTGVRNDEARFEDYSVIDAGILDSKAKAGDWPRR